MTYQDGLLTMDDDSPCYTTAAAVDLCQQPSAPVPEPSTLVILAVALTAMWVVLRARRALLRSVVYRNGQEVKDCGATCLCNGDSGCACRRYPHDAGGEE